MSTLREIIGYLETQNPEKKVKRGFGAPDSYRGIYAEVSFPMVTDTTIGEMLDHARGAIGPTFEGYKGGEYTYHMHTDAWLAAYGECGDSLSVLLLKYMTGDAEVQL